MRLEFLFLCMYLQTLSLVSDSFPGVFVVVSPLDPQKMISFDSISDDLLEDCAGFLSSMPQIQMVCVPCQLGSRR